MPDRNLIKENLKNTLSKTELEGFEMVYSGKVRDTYEKDNKKMNTEKSNKEISAKTICPMIYVPVCGLVNNVPHTFSNSCELTNAKAKKLFLGSCDQAIGAGIKGHQDLTSFQIQIQ